MVNVDQYLVGGFNPSEKCEGHLGWLFPIDGKIEIHVPNHQPDIYSMEMYMDILHMFFFVVYSSSMEYIKGYILDYIYRDT